MPLLLSLWKWHFRVDGVDMKNILMLAVLLFPVFAYADNDSAVFSSKAINLINDIHDWFSDDSLYINVAHAGNINAENNQFCTANSNSSCQSFAGVSVIQTGINHDNFYHRIVTVVEGNGGVSSYASQSGSVSGGENAQNCAAASCVTIRSSR